VFLGLIFFVFGLIGLLGLIQPPPDLPERLKTFNAGMMATGYLFHLIKATETLCGLMLLTGKFVPLALVVLAPISINIFLVHAFMAPSGLPLAIIIGLLITYLAFFVPSNASVIKPLFRSK
ncbi:MAG TPA: DoxX family membrane protein, partial [Bdellovibrionales bacterium]|nr:DoxX family membrane protein [Bdellovibrionales bacterium]